VQHLREVVREVDAVSVLKPPAIGDWYVRTVGDRVVDVLYVRKVVRGSRRTTGRR
jgi:hypothetical protein